VRIKTIHQSPVWAKLTFIGVFAIYLLWLIPNSTRLFLSDIYSLSPKNSIDNYGSKGNYNLTEWLQAREQLDHALSITPNDPNLLFSKGQLNAIRGYKAKGNKSISQAYYKEAALFYEKSLKIRPRDALTWANLLIAVDAVKVDSIRFNYTLQQAQDLSKNEKYLAEIVGEIAAKHQVVASNELKKAH
jgi:tetratricopeptide (TPR) repeat protein